MQLPDGAVRQTGQIMVWRSGGLALAAAMLAACTSNDGSTSRAKSSTEVLSRSVMPRTAGSTEQTDEASSPEPTAGTRKPPPPEPTGGPTDSTASTEAPIADSRPTGWGPTRGEWGAARAAVADMTDEQLAGQVIIARYSGTEAPLELVEEFHLGGVIVMGDNYESVEATVESNQLIQDSDNRPWPLVVGVDQEGGLVTRIGAPMTEFPAYMSLGASGDLGLARKAAQASGEELRAAGFTMVFAPVADVTVGVSDPTIGSRSAGGDARAVAAVVRASMLGYVESGIVPVLKHFPGHGSVTADSHLTLPHQGAGITALERRDFLPFAASVKAGAPAVMMAHISVDQVAPGVPADLAPKVVDLLTDGLNFEGLVVTDALEMEAVVSGYGAGNAAVAALRAGSDLLLMPADIGAAHSAIVAAVSDGSLSRTRLEEAAAKVVALMMHEDAAGEVDAGVLGSHSELSREVSAKALTVIQGRCEGPYVEGSVSATGDPDAVELFNDAAQDQGLTLGGGTTVALIGAYGEPASADIVVSLDTPYVLSSSSAAKAKLALYGSTPQAMGALVDVLVGEAVPLGHAPVNVPGATPPSC